MRKAAITSMICVSLCVLSMASVIQAVESILSAPAQLPLNFLAQSSAKEGVRAELIRLQAQKGLTLAWFYRGIHFVEFEGRTQLQTTESFVSGNGVELGGAVSRDGTEVAFSLGSVGGRISLGIAKSDGTNLREFPSVLAPTEMCWSYDESQLAISVQVPATQSRPIHTNLIIFSVGSKETREIGTDAFVTSQCWSPDGKQIVYEANHDVNVYDIGRKESRVLAKGKFATWSSDGQWLAFLDDKTYYAANLAGGESRILFREKGALSGLWWSPDSHIVAYLSRNREFEGPLKLTDVGLVRLRVKRLDDGAEDWVAQVSDAFMPSFQWVKNPDLLKLAKPQAAH